MGASTLLNSRPGRVILLIIVALSAFFVIGPTFFETRSIPEYFGTESKVDEIYGLLHLVIRDTGKRYMLTEVADIDPTEPLDLSVYTGGKNKWFNWNKEVKRLNEDSPIVVFSKTYCPYSLRAKELLASYDIQPPPRIVEVDGRTDSSIIKALLSRLTGRATFPNIVVKGGSIGGSDELQSLHETRELEKILREAGAVVRA